MEEGGGEEVGLELGERNELKDAVACVYGVVKWGGLCGVTFIDRTALQKQF